MIDLHCHMLPGIDDGPRDLKTALQMAELAVADGIALTANVDVLKDVASGEGPKQSLLALGYAGWTQGQLETEIEGNS